MTKLSGPLFEPADNDIRVSSFNKQGAHYNIYCLKNGEMFSSEFLKHFSQIDDLNFLLFSTSGVHGSYKTLEDIEVNWDNKDESRQVTILYVQPRTVTLTYGNVIIESLEDLQALKDLRAKSLIAVSMIGFG